MTKNIFIAIAIVASLFVPQVGKAQTDLAHRLSGRILLQVQAHGEAWYLYPVNLQRYYLGRPIDAFKLMSSLGLGISNRDFSAFNGTAPRRLAGRILLKVQDLGKAYYVNPIDLKMTFLGSPDDAFKLMRQFGLGITTSDINHLPVSGASAIPADGVMNITVSSPVQNQLVISPLVLQGQARVFENTLNYRLKDSTGRILAQGNLTAQAPDVGQFGPFEKSISFVKPTVGRGALEVFDFSAKDGSEIDKVIIAVEF